MDADTYLVKDNIFIGTAANNSGYTCAVTWGVLKQLADGKLEQVNLYNKDHSRVLLLTRADADQILNTKYPFMWLGEWAGKSIHGKSIWGYHKLGFIPKELYNDFTN